MNLFRAIAIAALGLLFAVCADATFLVRGKGKKYIKKAGFTFGGCRGGEPCDSGDDVFGMIDESAAEGGEDEDVMAAMEPPVEEVEVVSIPDIPVPTEEVGDDDDDVDDCVCTAEFAPVCCADVEYPNACEAECAGVAIDTCVTGPCEGSMATPAPMPLYGRA